MDLMLHIHTYKFVLLYNFLHLVLFRLFVVIHVSQPSACRYIRAVALGLQSVYSKFISMPGSADMATIKSQFYELANLPGVLGLVDGTHVRIQKPSENEADHLNRHFYHSINVQAICLPNGRFSGVLARFPGSVHDSRIWKLSQIGTYVENNFLAGVHILGDSGYMLKPYLLTPYRQPASNAQENYNYSHKKTRVLIEQTFGRWKRRFHCLHGEIRMARDKVCTIIMLEDSTIDHHTSIMDEPFTLRKLDILLQNTTGISLLSTTLVELI